MERFDDILNPALRDYNRAIVALNLLVDSGEPACEDYVNQFEDKADRIGLLKWGRDIQRQGRESMSRLIQSIITPAGSHAEVEGTLS